MKHYTPAELTPILANLKHDIAKHDPTRFNSVDCFFLQEGVVENFEFVDIDFYGQWIQSAEFKNCTFKNCAFVKTILWGTQFTKCEFYESRFLKAELSGTTINNCLFKNCDLSYTKLVRSILSGTKFVDCNFLGAFIRDNEMVGVHFENPVGLPEDFLGKQKEVR